MVRYVVGFPPGLLGGDSSLGFAADGAPFSVEFRSVVGTHVGALFCVELGARALGVGFKLEVPDVYL